MRWMFKQQYLQKTCFKSNKVWVILTHLKLWVAVARHNFIWVKIKNKLKQLLGMKFFNFENFENLIYMKL